MTILTMLQNSINDGLSSLGKNTFQIQKNDNVFGGGHAEEMIGIEKI
ncbi:MAG: hypothetical protein MZV64_04385 [Ignavibacteriales bacterium]|nr:hypothetical protein [Ignavibacteriales bacterium]